MKNTPPKPNKIVKCCVCGKKGKTIGKAHYVYVNMKSNSKMKFSQCAMIKGDNGNWKCINGFGCSKQK